MFSQRAQVTATAHINRVEKCLHHISFLIILNHKDFIPNVFQIALQFIIYIYIYIYIRVSVGLRNTKECSMSYRQSEMYKLITYLKDLPLQTTDCSGKSLRYVINLYISLCLYDIEHSFVFRKPTLTRIYSHPTLVVHSRFRNPLFTLKVMSSQFCALVLLITKGAPQI